MSARLLLAAAIVLGSVTGAQAHIDRARQTFTYGAVNGANEYAAIDGNPLTYDAAGNLTVDEDGRQYFYDEFNRLTEVRTSGNAVLVRYTYDALGRRVLSEFSPNDPPNAYSIRYVYDGQRIIEERDGADALAFYHVNGAQYIDERVATYEVPGATAGVGGFTYYLAGSNYSVTGKGNSDGSVIERIDFGSGGDFANGPAGSFAHDAEPDLDIDLADFASLQVCFATTDPTCLAIHDFDLDGVADGVIDIDDFDAFAQCMNGPDVPPLPGCAVAPTLRNGTPPPTGTFALHGRPIDVLADGKVLLYVRARFYDPQHGRWFQRDPSGYVDGGNLYESFRGNASRFTDPEGKYTKLASGWNQGDDVVYQRFPWLWSSAPSDTFPVGRYYYHEGQKLVVFDDPFEEYAYVLSFEGVEQWSRGVHDSFDYRDFATKRGLRVDRTTGKVVKRSFSQDLALWLEDEVAAHTIDIDFLDPVVFFAGPAFTTLTAETAPGLIVEETRTVSRLEYGLAAGTTVLQVVPIAQLGTRSLGAGTGVAAELRLSGTAGQFARTRAWTFGNLPAGVLGATDEYGNIVIRSGLRGPLLRETVRHESVHRFFSPRSGPLLATRAQVGVSAYRHSHLIRYLEEALAEGYGTGSIRHGMTFPLRADYGLNAWRIGAEGTIYIGGTAGGSYLLYSITDDAVQP